MGILNLTPDSFSDGGCIRTIEEAVRVARRMRDAGAMVVDVGGESTRPGADPVSLDEELRRVVPVVEALAERVGLPVSVDTRKAAVFSECWQAGASLLNDVSGLTYDPEMAASAALTEAAVVVMHMRGDPATMAGLTRYADLTAEVAAELAGRVALAEAAGIPRERLIADPGLGFAKDAGQSLELLTVLEALRPGGDLPLLVGPSRKRFLGEITGHATAADRDAATAALCALLAEVGVEMVRVHAVAPAVDAVRVAAALATCRRRSS
jgi:dihydropteroate synthase